MSEKGAGVNGLKPDELAADHVLVGKIIKAHGIKGEVKVFPYSGDPQNFLSYKTLVLVEPETEVLRRLAVSRARGGEKTAILELEGVAGRDAAEALRGFELWALKADFPEPEPDEYYWHTVEGARVVTDSGRELGTVTGIFNAGAHDILVVTGQGREYLIPVLDEIVRRIDEQNHTLVISPLPGLLELNSGG